MVKKFIGNIFTWLLGYLVTWLLGYLVTWYEIKNKLNR
ncbi:hypothetical protein PLUTE_b1340 [Pseudoalteromonas luteoviolacea DSM 6061]|nr:hypothetical protein [Pseudoalteromonas luteoviolacea DSM 6061]